jgi:hypothetical protein
VQVYLKEENFSFTFIEVEVYAASEKWQKLCILNHFKCKCGAAVEYNIRTSQIAGSIPLRYLVFS